MTQHPLQSSEAIAASVQKTPFRVTLESIEAKVVREEYINPLAVPHLTICVLVLQNGYSCIGTSAPADPANFDAAAGKTFARADALRKVWPLEGYLLRQEMAQK